MKLIISFLLLIPVFSCSDFKSGNSKHSDHQDVTFEIFLPEGALNTRSQTVTESNVNEVVVLVFEKGKLLYTATGINIRNNSSAAKATFKARLLPTDATVDLYVVANANDEILKSSIAPGDTQAEVKNKITRSYPSGGISGRFSMFGQHNMKGISSGAIISEISMVRSVARVDVNAGPVSDKFTLETVQVFRATDNIQIIPDILPPGNVVTSPSVQGGWNASVKTTQLKATDGTKSAGQIYLPESVAVGGDNPEKATCIVVGGRYSDDQEPTYYRIDFKKADGSYPAGQILRNHRYLFTIESIWGPGWSTPEEAAENIESDVTVSVEDWNDEGISADFDATYFYIISPRNLYLKHKTDSSAAFEVKTNIDDYTIQWADGSGIPSKSIKNDHFEATISPDTPEIHVRALHANTTKTEIRSEILIRAKRFSIKVNIRQLPDTRRNEVVRVMSFDGVGCLGAGNKNFVNYNGLQSDCRPMRMILNNHFRPDATVDIADIIFTAIYGSSVDWINKNLTSEMLSEQDILFLNYDIRPDAAISKTIVDWLEAKKTRVLIVSHEWKNSGRGGAGTNLELLKLLDIQPYWYNNGWTPPAEAGDSPWQRSEFRVPFEVNEATRYFFKDGPFTVSNPVSSCYFFVEDAYWGRAEPLSTNIIPLIKFKDPLDRTTDKLKKDALMWGDLSWTIDPTGDGKMILGIDPVRRIVYVGDSEIFSRQGVNASATRENNARIGDDDGNLSNEYSRIMANLWAWMIEEVVLAN